MVLSIVYNGVTYRKHKRQPYFYCSEAAKIYSRSLHRQMWFDVYGEIPKGFEVHHKNEDSGDNRIENFEVIHKSDHMRMHLKKRVAENPEYYQRFAEKGREAAKAWHASKDGRAWHKMHAAKIGFNNFDYGRAECEICKTDFKRNSWQARFCSNKCKSKNRRNLKLDYIDKICKHCSTPFRACKYTGPDFCQRTCYNRYHKKTRDN